MPWKKERQENSEEVFHTSKLAIKVKAKPLFYKAKTRLARELNLSKNCKNTTNKKLTKSQSENYNQILDEERLKNEPKSKAHNQK